MRLSDLIRKSPHRNLLERQLAQLLPTLHGTILDIGSKNRRYDYLLKQKPTAIDMVANPAKEVEMADITNIPFSNETYDSVICIEVLEYVRTPERAVEEIARVLKPGGVAVVSVPFMYRTHDDVLRYTNTYLEDLFSHHFENVRCVAIGNAYTVILTIVKAKINMLHLRLIRYICLALYLPFVCLGMVWSRSSLVFASGYIVIAKK